MISKLSLFEYITCCSSVSVEAIVNSVFHVSDFLRLFMISFKYGSISSRDSLIDRVLVLSLLLSYSI